MASTLCCLVVLLFLVVLGRAQVPYSYCMHFAKCFGAHNAQLSRLGGSFVRCFSVSVLSFYTSPNSGVKICGGFLRSENTIFPIIFAGCASFSCFFFSAAIARDCPFLEQTVNLCLFLPHLMKAVEAVCISDNVSMKVQLNEYGMAEDSRH